MSLRVFKRLEIALNSYRLHDFFLERMFNVQINNKGAFQCGPFICVTPENYWSIAGQIDYSIQHFMTPYTIACFGNNVTCSDKSTLTRLWLERTACNNLHAVCLMEPYVAEMEDYMVAINNRSWMPPPHDIFKNTKEIHQLNKITDATAVRY